jgi:hypothetical protein
MEMSLTNASSNMASRVEATGWGLLLLMTGVLVLVPGLPAGAWLVGLGVLLVGLNAARHYLGLGTDRFGLVLGSGAVLAGFGIMAGLDIPVFALLLIACGLAIIAGQVRSGRTER